MMNVDQNDYLKENLETLANNSLLYKESSIDPEIKTTLLRFANDIKTGKEKDKFYRMSLINQLRSYILKIKFPDFLDPPFREIKLKIIELWRGEEG